MNPRARLAITIAAAFVSTPLLAQISPTTNASVEYPTYEPAPEVRNGYTAENLRDTEVRGREGEKIGDVQDLIIGPDGQLRRLIVAVNEGFLGIGGRRLAIDWEDVTAKRGANGALEYITAPVTEKNVEEFGLFKDHKAALEGKQREWRATELLGDYVSLKDLDNYGTVTDLMFDKQGQLRAIAASPDINSTLSSFHTRYANDGWEPGDEYFRIPYSTAEIKKLLPGKQRRTAEAED